MLQFLIILALSIAFIAVLLGWRRDRRLLFKSRGGSPGQDAERTTVLEKANEDLKASRADLQRRWLNQNKFVDCRQNGNYPKTGFSEISG